MSVFSVPSGRDSATYSSMWHPPLRGGGASPLVMLPPSPSAPKGRRCLRKKSHPPDNYLNVFELLDRTTLYSPTFSIPAEHSKPGPCGSLTFCILQQQPVLHFVPCRVNQEGPADSSSSMSEASDASRFSLMSTRRPRLSRGVF
ncbi:hypothetical protein V8E53_004696 [Lactarius tabidus]